MKSMRLSKALALSFLFTSALYADIHDRIEYKLQRVLKDLDVIINGNAENCTPINQLEITQGGGVFIISKSGLYCVTEDVTGLILVDADCVCIDLGCHTINANGADSAIVGTGHQGLKVFNGCITNSGDAAILLTEYKAVELYNLHIHDYFMDGIRITDSSQISVNDIDFINNDIEERAILVQNVDTFAMSRCNATGFLSTIGAVVQFDSCSELSVSDVNVTKCTKTLAAPSGGFPAALFNPACALVDISNSTDFAFNRLLVNKNLSNSAQTTNLFSAIRCVSSSFGTFKDCTCNENTTINGGNVGVILVLWFSGKSINFYNCECNNNFADGPLANYAVFAGFAQFNSVMENCKANNNHCTQLSIVPGMLSTFAMMGISSGGSGNIIRRCSASFNILDDAGAGRSALENASCAGFSIDSYGLIEDSESIGNSMGSSHPNTYTKALTLDGGVGQTVRGCTIANQKGGAVSIGIEINTTQFGVPTPVDNVNIVDCKFADIAGYGIQIGKFWLPTLGSSRNITIDNCTFDKIGRPIGDSAAIRAPLLTPTIKNLNIRNCVINDVFATSGNANAIDVTNAANVVIEDTIINSTTASGTGHGILFDTLQDSKILRCQFHENKSSGVELIGTNTTVAIIECVAMNNDIGFDFAQSSTAICCLVQDSKALSNKTFGFNHATALLSTSFIGNKAQCNGNSAAANYVIAAPGVINLQQLTWSTGTYSQITGAGATLGSPSANFRMVS